MRNSRKRNFTTWTPRTSKLAHEAKARKRMELGDDGTPRRLHAKTLLGTLSWHGVDGSVRKLVVRQGRRANSILLDGMNRDIGWDFLFRDLRKKLSIRKVEING